MPTLTRSLRGGPPRGRKTPRLGALAALALAAGLASAAPATPSDAGGTANGNASTAELAQIREYCDRIRYVSARNVTLAGAISLVAIALVLLYAGTQRKAKTRALAERSDSEAALRSVAAAAQDAMVMTDERGDIAYWNPAAEALFGMTPEQALGRPVPSLFADAAGLAPEFDELLFPDRPTPPGGATELKRTEAVHLNGHRIPVRTAFTPLHRHHPRRAIGIVRRRSNPIEPAFEPRIADAILDNAGESIVITDAAGNALRVNAAYCRLTGYTPEEVIGNNQRMLSSGHHDRTFYEAMWSALLDEGRWEGKIWNRRKDGSIFLENLAIVALRDAAGTVTHYLGIFTDITHRGLDPAQISQLAFYDPLTGLATRALLIDHLSAAVHHSRRNGRRVALFYLNLDGFGRFNERHGHAAGDALLKAYAERLEGAVRQEDTVARPGGDEFALILGAMASLEDVPRVADKLLQRLAEPIEHDGQGFQLNASIGISLYPDHGEEPEQLVGLAREAMTKAKAAGKNRWVMHADDDRGQAA